MATLEEIADRHGGLPVDSEDAHGWWIGGVFVGKQLLPGVFAERVSDGRYMVRQRPAHAASTPVRVGEVFGGRGLYLATRMSGEVVGRGRSVAKACAALCRSQGLEPADVAKRSCNRGG